MLTVKTEAGLVTQNDFCGMWHLTCCYCPF